MAGDCKRVPCCVCGIGAGWRFACSATLQLPHPLPLPPLPPLRSGWFQALLLWNYVLSVAVLVQRLVVAVGLRGLLPGAACCSRGLSSIQPSGAAAWCLQRQLPCTLRPPPWLGSRALLLPCAAAAGEEVVTRESFISIVWRLVPYWMNQV